MKHSRLLPSRTVRFVVFLLLVAGNALLGQDISAPSIQICEGGQTVCIEDDVVDLCVKVTVEPSYPEKIDSFQVNWDDGTPPLSIPGTDKSFTLAYRYDFSALFESCDLERKKLVSLSTFINGEVRPIVSFFPLTALNPPEAKFERIPQVVCVGEEFSVENGSCPKEELQWTYDFGDGGGPTDSEFHTYADTGVYLVTLAVENDCGEDQITETIRVIERPVAIARPDSGLVNHTDPVPQVCLGGSATIRLNGAESIGLRKRKWTVAPARGVRIAAYQQLTTYATFTEPGTYTFTLAGTNGNCASSASASFTVEVLPNSALTLEPQEDVCISLDYCPTPWLPEATYTLNGKRISECPGTLGPGTYVLAATTTDAICGTVTLRDTFNVSPQAVGSIFGRDTLVCDQSAPLFLRAEPAGGRWELDGRPFTGQFDPGNHPSGRYRITYGNEPCLQTDTLWIEVAGAEVTVPADTFLCLGSGPVRFTPTPAGGTFNGPFIEPDGTFDPQVAGVGTFRIDYAFHNPDLGGCGDYGSFTVTVADLDIDFVSQTCGGEESCFSLVGELPYERVEWNFGDGAVSTDRQACHAYGAAGVYTVSVTVTSGPCQSTVARQVEVNPGSHTPPVAGFTLKNAPDSCSELEVTVTDRSFGSDITRTWSLGDRVFSTDRSPEPIFLAAGERDTTYVLTLEVRNGCFLSTFADTVRVKARPVARFAVDRGNYCSGETIRMINQSGGAPASYEWLRNGEVIGTGPEAPEFVYTTATEETLELCLRITNDCGTDTYCERVTVGPGDVRAFFHLSSSEVCVGDSLRITNHASDGAAVSYTFGDGNGSSATEPAFTYRDPGTYRIEQRAAGCGEAVFAVDVTVRERPDASFTAPAAACVGESVHFVATGGGSVVRQWDFGDGSAPVEGSAPAHTFPGPGSYRVCLTVRPLGDAGCPTTVCQTVTVRPNPKGFLHVSDSLLCPGQTVQFAGGGNGAVTVRHWTFGDGADYQGAPPAHRYDEPGDYSAKLLLADNAGCRDSVQLTIRVREPADAYLEQTSAVSCAGAADAALQIGVRRGVAPFTYRWTDGSAMTYRTDLAAGAYRATVTDANGCSRELSHEIIAPESIRVEASVKDVTCFGRNDGHIDASASGGTGALRVRWSSGERGNSFDRLTAGTHALRVTDEAGCSLDTVFTVREAPALDVTFRAADVTCYGARDGVISLTPPAGGTAPYTISLTGSTYRESGRTVTRFDRLEPDIYILEVTDANECTEAYDVQIMQPDPLVIDVLQDTVVLPLGGQAELLTHMNADEASVHWSPAYELSCDDCPDPVASPRYRQQYTVTLTDEFGCQAADTVLVDVAVSRDVYLPNTFTPNGDGKNDVFRVRSAEPEAVDQVVSFEVRDRWGSLLYRAEDFPPNDPAYGWDGTFHDQPAHTGHYAYQVVVRYVDGFEKSVSGTILIIR